MKYPKVLYVVLLLVSIQAKSQTIDTLVDVNNLKLHFKITQGKGTPILFESGGGLDANQWDSVIMPLYRANGATLITYDRQGFGKSEIDTSNYSILSEIKRLEIGLSKLGYGTKPMILVCHSLGGFYSRVYASMHPKLVKGIIMLDPRIPSRPDMAFARSVCNSLDKKKLRQESLSLYYVLTNIERNSDFARQAVLDPGLPILDIMAEHGPFDSAVENDRFKADQRNFVKESTNRVLLYAEGSSHNIPQSKPQLVIEQIVYFYKKYN